MRVTSRFLTLLGAILVAACSGGGSGAGGDFRMIEFLEAGQDQIPRNRRLTFRFSSPVLEGQDLYTRLRIQNVIQETPNSNFARSRGLYLVNGEEVQFTPRLPKLPDRSDAGFLENGSYHVFLSGGPDGLRSTSGDSIPTQQEFIFETNIYFEDIFPAQPPRAIQLVATDPTDDSFTDISRLDPRPAELAQLDNATLLANGRVIEPGGGGGPDYPAPWHIELRISEPVDPATITDRSVEMYEIFSDAMTTAPDQADADHFGTRVNFRVAIRVETVQSVDVDGNYDTRIRVIPVQTLVDNTRYRISFSGDVLGLDFRKTFRGDNGLTGDGQTVVDGVILDEPGGLGYVSEFLVYDRAAISTSRAVLFDPAVDGIQPELGQTVINPEEGINSALYNPAANPGTAVGFLSAFGQGTDGNLAISGSGTTTLNTGDIANEPLGSPFYVLDLNPTDEYNTNTLPGEVIEYDSPEYFELELENFSVSTSAILRVEGVNPVLFRVQGITEISGKVDLAGGSGNAAGGGTSTGGKGGAGGYDGATSTRASTNCTRTWGTSCVNFADFMSVCNHNFPNSLNGSGPGRGYAGGEIYTYDYTDDRNGSATGTGGGGAGHAEPGGRGEDRMNTGGASGTPGPACSTTGGVRNSSVVGLRSMGGAAYGDREVVDVTIGGSGGASGGASFAWGGNAKSRSGGGGGGGGGSIAIISAGPILAIGGIIDASGGNGGKGSIGNGTNNWYSVGGGGGGGAGGTITLISGNTISLTAAVVDAAGGVGGPRADNITGACGGCNAGGDGGNGFIFLMDADGEIEGHIPNRPGDYDSHPGGVLTIRAFDATRFSSITAVTELFPMSAANPAYQPYPTDPADILIGDDIDGLVNDGQRISVLVSAAKSNADDPLLPDLNSESIPFEVAMIEYRNGGTAVRITGDLRDLNEIPGSPNREAFVRVQAAFHYDDDPVQAALGPFCYIEQVKINYDFN